VVLKDATRLKIKVLMPIGLGLVATGVLMGVWINDYLNKSHNAAIRLQNSSLIAFNGSLQEQLADYAKERIASLEWAPRPNPLGGTASAPVGANASSTENTVNQVNPPSPPSASGVSGSSTIEPEPFVKKKPASTESASKVMPAPSLKRAKEERATTEVQKAPATSMTASSASVNTVGNSGANTNASAGSASVRASAPPLTAITMEQAGIAGMDTTTITFRSGRVVAIGGLFPSGEQLLSVDPVAGQFVTDRRVIVLSKAGPANPSAQK
jgi:hypothetical protein